MLVAQCVAVDETPFEPHDGSRPRTPRREPEMQNYRPTRPQHRSKSHHEAHAEDEPGDVPETHLNPLIPRGEARLITDQAGLLELISRLRAAGSFAYDSEFIGE